MTKKKKQTSIKLINEDLSTDCQENTSTLFKTIDRDIIEKLLDALIEEQENQ